jgi:hypothetical protein
MVQTELDRPREELWQESKRHVRREDGDRKNLARADWLIHFYRE